MELFEKIRKAHDREGLSIRELAKRYGTHRRTVRQALASAIPPERKSPPPKSSPALEPWKPVIDGWIEADRTAPRKQRHTARRIYERLVEEHGADVGESTVRRYVAQKKQSAGVPLREVTVSQHHPLGAEAEVDFGDVSFYLRGLLVVGKMFVMRLSASGMGFHRVYLHDCQEAFLEGHVRAFETLGGVAGRVRYDNLADAVVKVLRGRNRLESDRFVALRSHYGFDSFFCIPGVEGAHEKGGVEGEVGRFRRRRLVPMPRVDSLAELNELCAKGDAADEHRHIFGRAMTVGQHFEIERAELRPLPAEPFDARLESHNRVDPKSRVCVRQCHYSVPVRLAGRKVRVLLGAESVELFEGTTLVASHERAVGKGREVLDLDHYLEVFTLKPGAMPGSTALHQARSSGQFTKHHDAFYSEARRRLGDAKGTKAMVEVLLVHRSLPHAAVVAGIEAAVALGSIDAAVVAVEARRHLGEATDPIVPIEGALKGYDRPAPNLKGYDQLLKGQL